MAARASPATFWHQFVPENKNTNILYDEYLQGKNCDCELIAKDGIIIKMHDSVFRENVNPPLISSSPNATKTLPLHLQKWGAHVIRAFVEYLYIGYDAFLKKYGQLPEASKYGPPTPCIPIFALLEFAHEYHQLYLFQCCREIICSVTTKEDAENVLRVAKNCENSRLKLHYEKLLKS